MWFGDILRGATAADDESRVKVVGRVGVLGDKEEDDDDEEGEEALFVVYR